MPYALTSEQRSILQLAVPNALHTSFPSSAMRPIMERVPLRVQPAPSLTLSTLFQRHPVSQFVVLRPIKQSMPPPSVVLSSVSIAFAGLLLKPTPSILSSFPGNIKQKQVDEINVPPTILSNLINLTNDKEIFNYAQFLPPPLNLSSYFHSHNEYTILSNLCFNLEALGISINMLLFFFNQSPKGLIYIPVCNSSLVSI